MAHSTLMDLYYSMFPDNSKYLTFREGNSNVILSAPHGGGIKPIDIPYRKYGNRSGDTFTRRLIQSLISALPDNPYYIYSDIHRSRVDLNREIEEGAQGNAKAEKIWNDWNNALTEFKEQVSFKYNKGLYIDIHSHNKSDKFEIGYGLNVQDYLAVRKNKPIYNKSTMYAAKKSGASEYFSLFGNTSFPHLLESYGYKVLVPTSEAGYLNGGRNIRKFKSNQIAAVQIECPMSVLEHDLDRVAMVLAIAIKSFKRKFLN